MTSSPSNSRPSDEPPDVIVRGTARDFFQKIVAGKHEFKADEPAELGGGEAAPTPYDYLLAALGSCTSMTIGWHARKRQIPLQDIRVSLWQSRIHAKDCDECMTEDGMIHQIELEIELQGQFTQDQHKILMQAAERCPVHRTLTSEIKIKIRAAAPPSASAS
jgi:uncharacterized OsmC-like protein